MDHYEHQTIEQALASTEADAGATLQAAGALMTPLRRFRTAAQQGDLQELRASLEDAEQALAVLRHQFAEAKKGWSFNAQQYMSSGEFNKEVISTAQKMGVSMFERDDRLFCYPALLRVVPLEKAVVIDRKQECRIRPSILVNLLKDLQDRPPRFRPQAFLAALFEAYSKVVANEGENLLQSAPVVPLVDIYGLLTLLPGQAREYSKQEFARDIYLLHRGDVTITRSGARVSFPISRGVRGKTLTVIDESGEQRRYYGIRFTQAYD
jgi:hypothetical protein